MEEKAMRCTVCSSGSVDLTEKESNLKCARKNNLELLDAEKTKANKTEEEVVPGGLEMPPDLWSPGFEQRVMEMKFEDVKRCLMILEASNFYPPEEPKKGRKKVKVRLTEEYIDNMKKHPPPPPCKPVHFSNRLAQEVEERILARDKADRDEYYKILQQYQDQGFAEMEVEVDDDDDEQQL